MIRRMAALDQDAEPSKRKRARITAAATDNDATDPLQLAKFPAHSIVLDTSEYFKVQQEACWQAGDQPITATPASQGSSSSSNTKGVAAARRPTLHLTVDNAEQLPAAEAVIAAMYGVPDAISSLEQHQAVHAVVIADMVHAEAAGQQALQVLRAAAESDEGLTAAALQALAGLPVWPSYLLQLLPAIVQNADEWDNEASPAVVQQLLVAAFGDLQAVWSDSQLQKMLLALPLPAMQLLLSSDQLRVPSEDTVLYTARRYVNARVHTPAKKATKEALANLVRAPQLSLFALSCAALSADSKQHFLGAYAARLPALLSLRRIASADELSTAMAAFKGAPASWRLGPRQITPLSDGVRLEWRLPVELLKNACKDSFALGKKVQLYSNGSPPRGGVAWGMKVKCWQESGATSVGLYAGPLRDEVPVGVYFKFRCSVACSWRQGWWEMTSRCLVSKVNGAWKGSGDFFGLPPAVGGVWDDAAWAAAGLPAAGELLLKLHVHSVE